MPLFFQCRKKDELTDDTYFDRKVMILGHRGMGVYYKMPGNTHEAILPAIGIGCDGCEIDVQITKDTVLVLFHSNPLDPRTSCKGRVYDYTWNELKQCKYLAFSGNIYINSVDELFSKLPNLQNLYFSFDTNTDDEVADKELYRKQFIRAIKRICDKYGMEENILIEGTKEFLVEAQKMGLKSKLFLAQALSQSSIDTAVKYSFYGICSQYGSFQTDADEAHKKGLYVMGYSPYNYHQNVAAIRRKVDILQTDDPISILKRFERYNYDYVMPN